MEIKIRLYGSSKPKHLVNILTPVMSQSDLVDVNQVLGIEMKQFAKKLLVKLRLMLANKAMSLLGPGDTC